VCKVSLVILSKVNALVGTRFLSFSFYRTNSGLCWSNLICQVAVLRRLA